MLIRQHIFGFVFGIFLLYYNRSDRKATCDSSDDLEQENSLSTCLQRILAQEPEILHKRTHPVRLANDGLNSYETFGKISPQLYSFEYEILAINWFLFSRKK